MLECAEAGNGVERAEAGVVDLTCVEQVDVEVVSAARVQLARGQRHPDPDAALLANVGEQRTPATAEIEQPPTGTDADLLGDVFVLSALSLLERQ